MARPCKRRKIGAVPGCRMFGPGFRNSGHRGCRFNQSLEGTDGSASSDKVTDCASFYSEGEANLRNPNSEAMTYPTAIEGMIQMTLDEFETIRLIDKEGLTQEQCAKEMEVARTTVQGIYNSARNKLAICLTEGLPLIIGEETNGGRYKICGKEKSCGKMCRRQCKGGKDENSSNL